jgi:ribosomal-protein-alanine N-acetyltransferase
MYYSERIRLRRVDPVRDLEDRYRWMNDPAVTATLGMRPARLSREEIRAFLERSAQSTQVSAEFAIETLEGVHIGGCSLREFNHVARSAEFAILIGEAAYRGKGYGTEATRLAVKIGFEEFNLNRIWLRVNANNIAGVRAYEKAGFVKEGLHRQYGFVGGSYYDAYTMAILRSDYERMKGSA